MGWFITLGTRFVVPALLPNIRATFGVNNAAMGFAVTVIWLTYGGMQFPAGALVDRVGERRLLAGSMLLAGVGLLAFAGSPSFAVLLLAGAVYGLGSGLYGPARSTVLSRTFPQNDGAAFGVVLAAGSVGAAALPVVAGVLAGWFDWRGAIGLFVPLFLLVAGGLWWAVPTREDRTASGAGRTLRSRLDGLRGAIFRRPVIVTSFGVVFLLFAFQGLTAFLPTYLVAEKGFSQTLATAVFAEMFVAGAVFQVVFGSLADRFGHRVILLFTAGTSVLPLLALPFASGLPVILVIATLFGLRFTAPPLTNAYIVRVLPEEVRGTAWGLIRSTFFIVGATASSVIGAMADRALFDQAFLLLAVITAVGTLFFLWMPPRESVV